MKALSLWEPWATLIALGVKRIETRSWPAPSSLLGERFAVHAAKRTPDVGAVVGDWITWRAGTGHVLAPRDCAADPARQHRLALGCVVATARLLASVPIVERDENETTEAFVRVLDPVRDGMALTLHPRWGHYLDVTAELPYGDYRSGRWAWVVGDLNIIDPVPARGAQRLWNWEPPDGVI